MSNLFLIDFNFLKYKEAAFYFVQYKLLHQVVFPIWSVMAFVAAGGLLMRGTSKVDY